MSDKPKEIGEREGQRIDVSRERECRYWCEVFGISPEELRHIVRQAGPMVSDVRRLLRSRVKEPRSA